MKNNIRMPDDEVFTDVTTSTTSIVDPNGAIRIMVHFTAKTNYGRFFEKIRINIDKKEAESDWEEIELPSLIVKEEGSKDERGKGP